MKKYLKLVKFSHTLFSLPFAIIGFLYAIDCGYSFPNLLKIIYVLFALVFARTAAMSFNRWTDWLYDAKNPRTKNREVPSGVIKPRQALFLTIISSVLFVAISGFISSLCFWLSPLALIVILGYSYTKRFTFFSHFILGLGLGMVPAAVFIAITNTFDEGLLFLCFSVMLWTSGFDIIYSLQDMDFDIENNLFSIPSKLGKNRSLLLSALLHIFSVLFLIVFWWLFFGGFIALIGIIVFLFFILYQHLEVHIRGLKIINVAFGTINGVASVFVGIAYLVEFLIN